MRKATDRQQRLDGQPLAQVPLNLGCRDEMIPILKALQHLYAQPKLRDEILRVMAADVNADSSRKLGRQGMDYWSILVLAAVRLGCNLNYDKLQDLAEQHHALRQMMGIGNWEERAHFDWRRIRDNITLVRPATLERINQLLVGAGHRLVPLAAQTVRADSFVVETPIHYPTESSLLRDGLRKVLECGAALADLLGVGGWRQHRYLYRQVKALARQIDRVATRKGAGYHQRLHARYRELLALAETLLVRAAELRAGLPPQAKADASVLAWDAQLEVFLQRTRHVCETARRRVLEGQRVPNRQKLFSVFETHTQLYKRGKAGCMSVLVWLPVDIIRGQASRGGAVRPGTGSGLFHKEQGMEFLGTTVVRPGGSRQAGAEGEAGLAAFLEKAKQAYVGTMRDKSLVTFDQHEQRALDEGRLLARLLLEDRLAREPAARLAEHDQRACCPKCGRPGARVTGPEEDPPERALQTRIGPVRFAGAMEMHDLPGRLFPPWTRVWSWGRRATRRR